MEKFKKIIYAVSVLAGTIIGVGIFALPYATFRAGTWVMLGYFVILGAITILVHHIFGELSLITPDQKRLPGFARIYLGVWGERVSFVSSIVGMLGSLLAYAIVGGGFLSQLISPYFGGNYFIYVMTFLAIGSIFIFRGIKAISKLEFFSVVLFLVILLAAFFIGKPFLNTANLFHPSNLSQLFLPYGIILFSLWGAALIPEIEEILGESKKLIRIVVPVSIIISVLIYLFFIYLVLGITGQNTTPMAIDGLKSVLGGKFMALMFFFGILTTFTSFVTIGLTLEKIFWYDLKIKKFLSWALTCFFPLALFIAGFNNFLTIISLIGAIMLGIDGSMILMMYERVTKKKAILLLAAVFVLGIVYEVIYFLK